MAQFGTVLDTAPGLTWIGTRSAATRELATKVDARWLLHMRQKAAVQWWTPFADFIGVDDETEIAKFPIDFEDLGLWQIMEGERVARAVKPLQYQTIYPKPFYRDRTIPMKDIRRNKFGEWPDKISGLAISAQRMMGALVRDVLFSTGTSGLSSKVYTYQGGQGGTQPLIYNGGHYCDPTDTAASSTFGNLHTSTDQAASGNALFCKGATAFSVAGWETVEATYMGRPGPGGVPLDMRVKWVLGGSAMKPKFKRLFKRTLILEDSTSGPAAAATSNIHTSEMIDAMYGEEVVICVVSGWLDTHPYLVANPTADQYWTLSNTYPARGLGLVASNGGAPRIRLLDEGSEYEILNDAVLIKGTLDMGIGAAFPHVFDEWRST